MEKITLRGAFFRSCHVSIPEKGTQTVTAACTCDLSDTVMNEMKWGNEIPDPKDKKRMIRVIPDGLDGKFKKTLLSGDSMTVVPNGGDSMKKFEFAIPIKSVYGFEVVTINDKEGEQSSRELRFEIEFSSATAAIEISKYTAKIGRGLAQFKLSYERQGELDLAPAEPAATEEQKAATAKAAD